jgi:hypothetical protein
MGLRKATRLATFSVHEPREVDQVGQYRPLTSDD